MPSNDRVFGYNVERPEKGLKTNAIFPKPMIDSGKWSAVAALQKEFQDLSQKAPAMLAPVSEIGWKSQALQIMQAVMKRTKSAQVEGITKDQESDKQKAKLLQSDMEPEHAAEVRNFFRAKKPGDVIQHAVKDGRLAAALLENPLGIPALDQDQLLKEVERAAMLYNMGRLYQDKSYDTHKTPSLDDPLAHGIDSEKIAAVAKEGLANYEAARSEVDTVRKIVSQAVKFVAITADISVQEAFEAMELHKA